MAAKASPQRSPWQPHIAAALNTAAERHGLEPAFVRAVAFIESSGNPRALSEVGAQGLMQLMPATARELGVKDAFDPVDNANGGAKYLAQLLKRYSGNEARALHAYNWGMGNVAKAIAAGDPVPGEVQAYARNVLARREVERQLGPFSPAPATAPARIVESDTERACSFSCPSCGRSLHVVVGGDDAS